MSIETNEITPDRVDDNLCSVGNMSIEMVGVQELFPDLLSKEAFVCTSFIESSCNQEVKAKQILTASNLS